MSTHTNTTTDAIQTPAGEVTRYNTTTEVIDYLKRGEELHIGGFPKHIVTVTVPHHYLIDLLNFHIAEDEVQAQVVKTDMSLVQLVALFGSDEAKAKMNEIDKDLSPLSYTLNLIGTLGFNL